VQGKSAVEQAAIAGRNVPQLVVITDPDYRILWLNDSAQRAFGPADELRGRFCYEAIEGRSTICEHCVVARSHASGKVEEGEIRQVSDNGRPLFFHVHAVPLRNDDGQIFAWLEATTGLASMEMLRLEKERLNVVLSMQQADARFASLAEVAPMGIGIAVDGKAVWVNQHFADIMGCGREELVGGNIIESVCAEHREQVRQGLSTLVTDKTSLPEHDVGIIDTDGQQRVLSVGSTYCIYKDRDAVMTVVKDVTAERQMQQQLGISNEKLTAINSLATSITSSLDLSDVLDTAIEQVMRLTDADAGIISLLDDDTQSLRLAVHRDVPDELVALLSDFPLEQSWNAQACETGQVLHIPDLSNVQEALPQTKALGLRSALSVPLKAREKTVGVLDLTSREQNHFCDIASDLMLSLGAQIGMAIVNAQLFQEKADSELLYRSLFETVPDPIALIAAGNHKLLSYNEPFQRQFGYSDEELANMSLRDIIILEDYPYFIQPLRADVDTNYRSLRKFEIRCIRKDRQIRDVSASVAPYVLQGKLVGFQVVARDVTDTKRLHQHMSRAEKLSAIGQLISGVAHELNNPLATILLATEMLLNKTTDPADKHKLETIIEQVDRSSALTEELRLFARRDTACHDLLDVGSVVQHIRGLVSPSFKRSGAKIVVDLPEELPPVLGDLHQLEQVFLNLTNNALQSMEGLPDPRQLTISVNPQVQSILIGTQCVQISFADTGIGISEDVQTRIFDPFFTTKPPGKGTGLGLSVSLQIIQSHGGAIYLDHSAQGATFVIELPIASKEVIATLETGPEETARQAVALDGRRVLVIDDEATIVGMLVDMLERSNCKVDGAYSAQEALDRLGDNFYDVILCDLQMSTANAMICCEAIIQRYPHLAKRLIVMTGDTATLDDGLLRHSPNPVLRKPFTYARLMQLIQHVHHLTI